MNNLLVINEEINLAETIQAVMPTSDSEYMELIAFATRAKRKAISNNEEFKLWFIHEPDLDEYHFRIAAAMGLVINHEAEYYFYFTAK